MRLTQRLRRTVEERPAPAPERPPGPPPGAPVTAYAGILDGHSLWLAIGAAPGTLALRDVESGEVHPLHSDLGEDDPDYRSVRADLLDLPGAGEATYDAVLLPATPDGPPTPIWTRPAGPQGPTRVPPSPAGDWQFSLGRTDDGTLRVRRRRLAPAVEVRRLDLSDRGVELTVAPGEVPDPSLLLLEQGAVVAAFPTTTTDAGVLAVVESAGLPEGAGQLVQLGLGSTQDWLPLRRRANDLVDATGAVLLPALHDQDETAPRLRLRWAADSTLAARLPEQEAPDDTDPAGRGEPETDETGDMDDTDDTDGADG